MYRFLILRSEHCSMPQRPAASVLPGSNVRQRNAAAILINKTTTEVFFMPAVTPDRIAIVEAAFAPYVCTCQADGAYYQIKVSQSDAGGDTVLYEARHPARQLTSLRTTAQLVLEIRQRMSAGTRVAGTWERAGLLS
jgi:hypothetical protein